MKKTVTMKVEEAELAEWTLAAHEAGDSLSGWLRKCANRSLPIKTMDQKAWEVGADKPKDETVAIVAPKPPKAAQASTGYVVINGKRLCTFCARKRVPACAECIKYNAVSMVDSANTMG